MNTESNNILYHELREKIALAFETQVLVFLPDEELHSMVTQLYPVLYPLKVENPDLKYNIQVSNKDGNLLHAYLIVDSEGLIKEEENQQSFVSDLLEQIKTLLDDYLKENKPLQPVDCELKIRRNKKSINISVGKK